MKVIKMEWLEGTERDVPLDTDGFRSIRPVVEDDGVGFSVCKTIIPKGPERMWHYKNHYEACFCIEGLGVLKNLDTGEVFSIEPDTIYVLDNNDPHTFQALEDIVLISIFNPPLKGDEQHDENGVY